MSKEKEIRKIVCESIETRTLEDESKIIKGYINKFNTRSQYMGFFEEVDKTAFDRTLTDNHKIYAMFNHNEEKILGSTASGSLKLTTDEVGLAFELTLNKNISYANDMYELIKNGDVDGCSFGFYVNEDSWSKTEDNIDLRIIKDLELIEVTITPFPAYLSSSVSCRSYEKHKEEVEEISNKLEEVRNLEIELMKLELI